MSTFTSNTRFVAVERSVSPDVDRRLRRKYRTCWTPANRSGALRCSKYTSYSTTPRDPMVNYTHAQMHNLDGLRGTPLEVLETNA